MSRFQLICSTLIIVFFNLISFTTTYASNPTIVNESPNPVSVMPWVQITDPVNPNTPYLANAAMTIGAAADNTAGNLASIVLFVNGQPVAFDTAATITSTYTPTSTGQYTLEAVATYLDDTQISTQITFNVIRFKFRELLIPMQVFAP